MDFGCGSGINLEGVKKLHSDWNLYGLDNNKFACQRAREKGFNVFYGDILDIDLPKSFFDIINMSHILEHLSDPKKTLIKVNRLLKMNGNLIISVPNFNCLEAKLFRKYWHELDVPRHLFHFTPKTISVLLNNTGYIIDSIKYEIKPEVIIKSLYYIFNKKDLRINPIIWRVFKPINIILSLCHETSVITVRANKAKNIALPIF